MKISMISTVRLTNGASMAYYGRLLESVNGDETVKSLFPEYVTNLQKAYEQFDACYQQAIKSVLVKKIRKGNDLIDNLYVNLKRNVWVLGKLAENQEEVDKAEALLNLLKANDVSKQRKKFRKLGVFCNLVGELEGPSAGLVTALGLEDDLALMKAHAETVSNNSALRMDERQNMRTMPVLEARKVMDQAMRELMERINAAILLGVEGAEKLGTLVNAVNALNYDYRQYELKKKVSGKSVVTDNPSAGTPGDDTSGETPGDNPGGGDENPAPGDGDTDQQPDGDGGDTGSGDTGGTTPDDSGTSSGGSSSGTDDDDSPFHP